jgi:HEAT repeat protein
VSAQVTFESVVAELKSGDVATRLRAVRLLKDAAYPEAAIPLAALVTDVDDEVQLEAIAAELNIFLSEKIVTRKRVGLVIEVRNKIAADLAFSRGPRAIGARPVPGAVLAALRTAARDAHPQIALESLYALGTLATEPSGGRRRTMLREIGPDLAAMAGARTPEFRYAAIRVIGRLFERRAEDGPIDPMLGDALVSVLNDNDRGIRGVAMQALGAARYERAIAALTEQFQYFGRGELAAAALEALARIGHPSSTPIFAAELAKGRDAFKALAIDGLARVGDRARHASIEKALAGDRNDRVLLAASFASVTLADAPIAPLVQALRKPKLAAEARQYLIEIASGRSPAFISHSQDPDILIRAGVADVLGLAGDPAALSIVEPMQRDRDPEVALAAERAVARLNALRGPA